MVLINTASRWKVILVRYNRLPQPFARTTRSKSRLNWNSVLWWSLAWQGLLGGCRVASLAPTSFGGMPATTRRSRHNDLAAGATSTKKVTTTSMVGASTRATTTTLSATKEDNGAAALPQIVTPDVNASKRTTRRRRSSSDESSESACSPSKRPRRGGPRRVAMEEEEKTKSTPKPADEGKKSFSPPADWQETYQLVEELRQDRTAPCDHSGAEALADMGNLDAKTRRLYSLVALLLSSQTKDAVVAAAMKRMHEDQVLTVPGILALEQSKLSDDYLYSVGFRNNKAKYLQQACQILQDTYNGDIPPTADDMMELPGVGPKMAYICENIAWNRQSGIGVDTHMHRLFGLLGWVPRGTKTPEKTRLALQSWLPREYWKDVNLLWVGFGQEVQQQKQKALQKALGCAAPYKALRLFQRCGMDVRKEAKRFGLEDRVKEVLANKPTQEEG